MGHRLGTDDLPVAEDDRPDRRCAVGAGTATAGPAVPCRRRRGKEQESREADSRRLRSTMNRDPHHLYR